MMNTKQTKTVFQKRHYEVVAKAIETSLTREGLVLKLIEAFKEDNPRFNGIRFLKVAGMFQEEGEERQRHCSDPHCCGPMAEEGDREYLKAVAKEGLDRERDEREAITERYLS